ncbi:O-antigen ligase family protein [Rhodococcus rhodnii]|uniref:O-antigen ligase-related domain-containing protein n=1 Tax=Rhodococcus rhodnii LMG 5362 TaxID=1273125 RepID=R7WS04_9NOCA|nr:O-antigen ligase family protein [Rhodococcus rhodnii]EOM78103.1 hypothetical protein Rrhod_0528 [Rhodococcus rhodnii LMG 5362]
MTPFDGLLAIMRLPDLADGWKEGLLVAAIASAALRNSRTPCPRGGLAGFAPWWPAAAAFVLIGTASAFVAHGTDGIVAVKITFFYLVAVPLLLWWAPFDSRDRDVLVSILMATGVAVSVLGLVQQRLGPDRMVGWGYEYGEQVRSAGGLFRTFSTFGQPFPFALFVTTSLLVGGAVALGDPRRLRNSLFLVMSPIMAFAMTTAVVRAAVLGLVLGAIWIAATRFPPLFALLGAGLVTVLCALPFLPASAVDALTSGSSLDERRSGWSGIVDSLAVHPLGAGLGATGSAADALRESDGGTTAAAYQPDNYYVKVLVELGPIGLWLVVLLLGGALATAYLAARTATGDDAAFAGGVGASIVAAIGASIVSTYFEIFPLDFFFWLLLGAVGCAQAQRGSCSDRWRSRRAEAASRRTAANS